MRAHPSQVGGMPQGYSHCCDGRLYESDRVIGAEHYTTSLHPFDAPNRQTATQIPRQLDMMTFLRHIGYTRTVAP